jgi:hypothetical protein
MSEDATHNDRKTRPLSCARPLARSEEREVRSKEQEARSKDDLWGEARRTGDS